LQVAGSHSQHPDTLLLFDLFQLIKIKVDVIGHPDGLYWLETCGWLHAGVTSGG
jgi:hypothetical protein